jgi:hypothetical protein
MKRWRMSLLPATPGAKSLRDDGTVLGPVATARAANSEQCRAEVRLVPLKIVQFLALALTALALVPSGAHLFELPSKINLEAEPYFIIQNIYRGWSLFGIVLIGALIANLALALLLRGRGAPFALALFGSICIALTLVIFFIWTYPANQATNNWTMIPNDWEQLRRRWEYSHAVNAVITFAAFCSVAVSSLMAKE